MIPAIAPAREPGAHVHGVATLQIAIDKSTMTLWFESPLDNLLGFEHPPRTDAEKTAVRALRESLQKPKTLFVPTGAAACDVVSIKLDSPVFNAPAAAGESGAHADLDAEYVFDCKQPAELRDLQVRLFSSYPALRRIDAQVAGPRGQVAARLTPARTRVSW